MRAFLDFEASSLAEASYPVEVGWVFEDGREEDWLIRPAPAWTDWAASAEAIHHLSRARLQAEGTAHDVVARRMLEALGEHVVYASAPSWDGKWLSVLLRAAGLPRHALRLRDSDEALTQAATEALEPVTSRAKLPGAVAAVIAEARDTIAQAPPTHRAIEDARRERRLWLEVRRLAQARAGG